MTKNGKTRVRFAPSPTGYLHVGGLRTALYNYLFARQHEGAFVLRIEDTDRMRHVQGAVENLIGTLKWAGLNYDEGPDIGGPFGPYVQSERLPLYRAHIEQLIAAGNAYRCFCTPERLEEMRKQQERAKMSPRYDRRCLALDRHAIAENIAKGIPFAVRMKVPKGNVIRFQDLIRGTVEFSTDELDDQVLLKSDGYPTYHLANVVDDHAMNISHVIRGEEWLPSTPKHILLYEFFQWQKPEFAHLPLLLNPDRSKLSKRQGDVAVEEYRGKGFLPEALINFVALLGWNPGDERELFTLEELVKEFSIERVGKSGAIFNIEKLTWLNSQHLRRKSDAEILKLLEEALARSKNRDRHFDRDYLLSVIGAMRARAEFVRDFIEKAPYFFEPPVEYEAAAVKKRWTRETPAQLEKLAEAFSKLEKRRASDFEGALRSIAGSLGVPDGLLIHAVRLAVTGVAGGPGVFQILEILGKDESVRRMRSAIKAINAPAA